MNHCLTYGLVFILTLLAENTAFAQGIFQTRLTHPGTESYGTSVVQSPDSNYVACGASNQSGFYTDAVLTKLDTNGNVLWAKRYGGVFIDWAWEVVNTLDGGFALAGYTNSFGNGGYDFYLIKTDADGNKEWEKTYGGADWDLAYALIQLPDSGYVLAGETYSYGNGNQDAFVVRTDKNGDTLWTRTFGDTGDEMFHSICYIGNGSMIAAGKANNNNTQGIDGYIVRLDTAGNLVWEDYKGSAAHDEIRSVKAHSSGSVMTMGYTDVNGVYDLHFMMIDTSDYIVIENNYSGGPNDDYGYDLAENSDFDFFFAGTTSSYGNTADGTFDIVYYQLTQNYSFVNGVTNGVMSISESVYSIKDCFDKGFVACGSSSVSGNSTMYVMKYLSGLSSVTGPSNINFTTTQLTHQEKNDFKIYPNPFSDRIQIESVEKIEKIMLFDLSGKLIVEQYENEISPLLDLTHLSEGVYFIKIECKTSSVCSRLIKQ